jgi:hypothetical protein
MRRFKHVGFIVDLAPANGAEKYQNSKQTKLAIKLIRKGGKNGNNEIHVG